MQKIHDATVQHAKSPECSTYTIPGNLVNTSQPTQQFVQEMRCDYCWNQSFSATKLNKFHNNQSKAKVQSNTQKITPKMLRMHLNTAHRRNHRLKVQVYPMSQVTKAHAFKIRSGIFIDRCYLYFLQMPERKKTFTKKPSKPLEPTPESALCNESDSENCSGTFGGFHKKILQKINFKTKIYSETLWSH